MTRVIQTKNIGMRPHYSGHPLAPVEIVYEVEELPARQRPRIPLGAKLLGIYIILMFAYVLIQGGINTFS